MDVLHALTSTLVILSSAAATEASEAVQTTGYWGRGEALGFCGKTTMGCSGY